ncbi:hypothetical protein EAF04_004460 [Stromatinia cepivora]|nr:hypothetical protein EAF04_004460 [Stromatinia cepivora]
MRFREEREWKGFGGCVHSEAELNNPFCANSCPSCCKHLQPTSTVNHQTDLERREEQMLHKEALLKLLDSRLHTKEARLREMKEGLEQQKRELCEDEDRLNLKESKLFAYKDSFDYYYGYLFDNTPAFSQHSPSHGSAPSYGGKPHSDGHNSNWSARRSRSNSHNSPQLVGRPRADSHNSIRPIIRVTPLPSDRRQYDGDCAPRRNGFHHSQPGRRTPEHQTHM